MTAEAKVRSNPMCIITWLVPRAGKMKRILCSDWLPERGRWVYRACSGFPALVPQEKSSLGHIINRSIIDQNDRGRQYPTHMSFLARAPQVSSLDTMAPCVWEVIALNLARDAHMGADETSATSEKINTHALALPAKFVKLELSCQEPHPCSGRQRKFVVDMKRRKGNVKMRFDVCSVELFIKPSWNLLAWFDVGVVV